MATINGNCTRLWLVDDNQLWLFQTLSAWLLCVPAVAVIGKVVCVRLVHARVQSAWRFCVFVAVCASTGVMDDRECPCPYIFMMIV